MIRTRAGLSLSWALSLALFSTPVWAASATVTVNSPQPASSPERNGGPGSIWLAQADATRQEPHIGTVPGTGQKTQAGHGPAVIPEPPPFPDQRNDDLTIWAIAGVSVMVLMVIFLIVKMVRRDVDKKRLKQVKTKTVNRPLRHEPGMGAVGHATISNTTVAMTESRMEDEPLTIIKTQWRDIQTNTGSGFPTISLIQADTDMQESVKNTGYNPFYGVPTSGIEVIEVAHSVPEVEALVWMGMNDQATAVLEKSLAETEHPAPKIWLMLFDQYARGGEEEKYNKLAKGFKAYFNAEVPTWNDQGKHAGKDLQDYPAVINKVVRLWGLPACKPYLDTLLYDNRNGTRVGFSLAAYSNLVFLSDLVQTLKAMDETPTSGDDLKLS